MASIADYLNARAQTIEEHVCKNHVELSDIDNRPRTLERIWGGKANLDVRVQLLLEEQKRNSRELQLIHDEGASLQKCMTRDEIDAATAHWPHDAEAPIICRAMISRTERLDAN